MKTQEFVQMLASGAGAVDRKRGAFVGSGLIAIGVAAGVVFCLALLGANAQLARYATLPSFWVREVFCAAMAAVGLAAWSRLMQPGRALGPIPKALAGILAALWVGALFAILDAPPHTRVALLMGSTALVCPFLIGLTALPIFVALVFAARRLAPTRLRASGAACGLAAGGLGALAYTLHCPELALAFLAVWYVLGIALTCCIGALLGPALLRW